MGRPIRILHVLPHRGGGGEIYINMLERLPGFVHDRIYLSAGRTPGSALASVPRRWLGLKARIERADVIHAHGDVASTLALPWLWARPAVMTTHGLHMLRRLTGRRLALMTRAIAAVASTSATVVCTSTSERDELERVVHDADRSKLVVIENSVDPPAAVDPRRDALLREDLGIAQGTLLGLFVGQLEARKAPLLAARAAWRIRAAGIPFVLAFAGDGPLAPRLDAMAGEAMMVLGYRSDVDHLMSIADVYVQPSEREGMSLALLQALANGLAVVASEGPGNPEAVGRAGILFTAGDESALVKALKRTLTDTGLRASLSQEATRRAREEFDVSRFLSRTEAVYRNALGPLMALGRAVAATPA
jgi:glycosyltransferase involved in cell wall biosynthesis